MSNNELSLISEIFPLIISPTLAGAVNILFSYMGYYRAKSPYGQLQINVGITLANTNITTLKYHIPMHNFFLAICSCLGYSILQIDICWEVSCLRFLIRIQMSNKICNYHIFPTKQEYKVFLQWFSGGNIPQVFYSSQKLCKGFYFIKSFTDYKNIFPAQKPAVQLLQIQEVQPRAHNIFNHKYWTPRNPPWICPCIHTPSSQTRCHTPCPP